MKLATMLDVWAPLLMLSVLFSWRKNFSMRGITYRSTVMPLHVDRAGKTLFYMGMLGTVDLVLRRLGPLLLSLGLAVPPSSARTAACLRMLLMHVPFATWALMGPLSEAGSTRDDRGFSTAATRSGLWTFLKRVLFRNKVFMYLSEEWRDLSAKDKEKWWGRHYVIAMHPHGLLPIGSILSGLTWAGGGLDCTTTSGAVLPGPAKPGDGLHQRWFPNIHVRAAVASGACGLFPGFYEMFTKLGAFECTKPFIKKVLREGKDVAIFPGGAQESAYAAPGKYICLVKKHRGFVRLALEERLDILPMWCFGDESLVPQSLEPHWLIVLAQKVLKESLGLLVPPTLAGLPRFPPLTLVTGVPVSLEDLWPKNVGDEVPDASVDEGHARYMKAIQELFDRNKGHVLGGHEKAVVEFL